VAEFIEHGVNGHLVPPDDVESLSSALLSLIQDPMLRFRLGREAARTIQTRFDHTRGIQDIIALFRENDALSSLQQRPLIREAAE
jgi:glycosyltransferase involved in cell wall biosynthesis